jgi:hypothetical protein
VRNWNFGNALYIFTFVDAGGADVGRNISPWMNRKDLPDAMGQEIPEIVPVKRGQVNRKWSKGNE